MNKITDFDSIRQIFAETLDKSTSFEDWMIRIAKEIHYIGFNDGMLAQAAHDKLLVEEGHLIPKEVIEDIKTEIEEQVLESLSDSGDDWFTAEKVNECLEIIDKYTGLKEDE